MTYLIAYILSLTTGILLLKALGTKENQFSAGLSFFLAGGLGLGISACIGFLSLPLFGKIHGPFIITVHLIFIFILFLICRPRLEIQKIQKYRLPEISLKKLFAAALLIATLYPIWQYANHYPFGGWDAWSCWNLKSRFLILGGSDWKNMLDPILWRYSPHYPLLLPLLNVWGWIFSKNPTYFIPLLNALIFTFLTGGLVFCGIKSFTKSLLMASLGTFLIGTLPFFITLATSQYCDIVLAYYLTAGLLCLVTGLKKNANTPVVLGGIFLGFLGFSKPEGLVASVIIAAIFSVHIVTYPSVPRHLRWIFIRSFFVGLVIASLPTIIFQLQYAPANQTFINGLAGAAHPSNLLRLKMILGFYLIEPITEKWSGLWILFLTGLLLTKGSCFKKSWGIIPAFLFLYLAVVACYYWLNTYFEISWWLSVTLNRILFSLLPVVTWWVLGSLGENLLHKRENGL